MLETKNMQITLTDETWKLLEQAAKRDQQSLDDYLHDLLLDTAAASSKLKSPSDARGAFEFPG